MNDPRIVQGDCLKVMATLPAASIDLVVTSPPDDDLRDYVGGGYWGFGQLINTIIELRRVVTPGGVVCWVIGDRIQDGGRQLWPEKHAIEFQKHGFRIHDVIVWHKIKKPMQRLGAHQQVHESILSQGV